MTNKRIKNGLIGIGTTLVPAGMTMVVRGQSIEGGILTAMGIACILGYSLLDDADKNAVLEYVDEDTLKQLADDMAGRVNEARDEEEKEVSGDNSDDEK